MLARLCTLHGLALGELDLAKMMAIRPALPVAAAFDDELLGVVSEPGLLRPPIHRILEANVASDSGIAS